MFEQITPVRAYESVVGQIEAAIHRGELQPGHRLPSERELVHQFGVSRSTVREALRVLQSRSVVQSRPGDPHGAVVMPFTTEALKKSISSLAMVEHLSLVELLQFRMIIEGCANQLAAATHTDEQLAAMQRAMDDMRTEVGGEYEAFSRADMAFHDTIADAADNKLLRASNEVVRAVVLQLIAAKIEHAPDSEEQMRDSCQRHALVLDAVRRGDSNHAAYLARKHIYEYYAVYLDPSDRDRLAPIVGDPPSH